MSHAIGFLELNSIAKGIGATDHMIKAADVFLAAAKPTCPGKFTILITGDVAAVNAAVKAGMAAGGEAVVDHLVIPRVHRQVVAAVNGVADIKNKSALGVAEYFSITSAILGADAAVKAADVELIEIRLGVGIGGKAFVSLTGDVSAVQAAVDAASAKAGAEGMLVSTIVIPNPRPELFSCLV